MRSLRTARWLKVAACVTLLVLWAMFLRPTWLGGTATYILVRGDSMEPTHTNGDFLFITAQPAYGPGDVVAFRVPEGEIGAGKLVVHRIIDTGDQGFLLQGDNNPAADPWRPSQVDIAGRVMLALPAVGRVIAIALSPAVAASIATALMVMVVLARGSRPQAGAAPPARTATRLLRNVRSTSR
jgi:signal peptidase